MYEPSHRAPPVDQGTDASRRNFLRSGLAVASLGTAALWLPGASVAVADAAFDLHLDRSSYRRGDLARLTIRENVDFKRRMVVSGPGDTRWHKIAGDKSHSVFVAKVQDAGKVTVRLQNRITETFHGSKSLDLDVKTGYPHPDEPFLAYSAGSFFRSRVDGAPVHHTATRRFQRFMRRHRDQRQYAYPLIRGTQGNDWGMPYALGHRGDPVWTLTGVVPSPVSRLRTVGFHAPHWFGDRLTGTADSPFVVIDRASGRSIWAANAHVVGRRQIRVSAAGFYDHRSNGLDTRNPRSNARVNYRSRGAIPDAMVIRRDLVDHALRTGGDLGHVLHMFMVETSSAAGSCHPMVGHESGKQGFGAEGQRIAIAPHVNIDARGLSPEGEVIARTLQNYGCYLGDNSGSSSGLKAEQESRGHKVWKGRLPVDTLRGITWDDFVVLPKGWQ